MTTALRVETEEELRSAALHIVVTLRKVEDGEPVSLQLPYAEDDALTTLGRRVNALLDALVRRREETLGYQRELEAQIETIERQQAAIRELSTPIIEVWSGVLCVPVVGVMDSLRTAELTSALLNAVVARKAVFAIIDITGIDVMDTRATDHFLRMGRAVRLLGAECALSGVNPAVAQTIAHMGVSLEGVPTYRTLGSALRSYVQGQSTASRAARPKRAQNA